jgi:hypothetical protein
MADNRSLGNRIVARELVIQTLLSQATLVGGIYTMGYDECLVLTNDLWKKQAGGVPQHCFLLATAMVPGAAPDVEDEEIIQNVTRALLRHHKIVTDAQKKIEEMNRAILET